ncbi:hypothetical protein [Halothiobacillus sp.]|uniref:hypothetical protein n=1 Tax=Halothiobacillus sp. TaxID=1891311 RepID=UPI00261BC7F9|nr:hypothetical protein [Halothiobacillus sp.]MDD4965642.1 hypothetical protein [Halothiobacillus sp.]
MKRIASNGLGRISSGTVMATCLPIRTVARGMDDYLTEKKPLWQRPMQPDSDQRQRHTPNCADFR